MKKKERKRARRPAARRHHTGDRDFKERGVVR